jgi:hypothetical protein
MAVIRMSTDVVWGSARWLQEALADDLRPQFPQGDAIVTAFDRAKLDGSHHVDMSEWAPSEKRRFAEAVRAALADRESRGPSSFASPEFFSGYVQKLRELIETVEGVSR